MALNKSLNVPKDAVMITDEGEASNYMWDIVFNWNTVSDTWALRYGGPVLGGLSAISGLIINKHYRTRFKLGKFGYLSAGVPIFVMPGVLTTLFHNHLVSTDILLMKSNCPVCYEVRSAMIQSSLGLAYPMVLGPAMALMLANKYATYRVPDLQGGIKKIFNFLGKHTKPFTGTLAYIAAVQLAASSVITYFEMKNNNQLRHKLKTLEEKLYAEGDNELL